MGLKFYMIALIFVNLIFWYRNIYKFVYKFKQNKINGEKLF